VLALPMVIIGQAFEETIREENTMSAERERRLKMILLKREMERTTDERQSKAEDTNGLKAKVRARMHPRLIAIVTDRLRVLWNDPVHVCGCV
jgi:hypothetical protein